MTGTCQNGTCFHGDEAHEEGLCWQIVDSDLEREQTTDKYCQCQKPGVIRRYSHPQMGYMEQETEDLMVTRKCVDCGVHVILLKGETLCMLCKDKPGHYKPVNPEVYAEMMREYENSLITSKNNEI